MSARLEHVSEVPGTPEQVWAVLTDLDGWKTWNPTLSEPRGELVEGSVVRMKLQLGRVKSPTKQTILEVTPPSTLRWQTRWGPPQLFLVTRAFQLERVGETTTRFEQSEVGTGLLARLIFKFSGPPTVRGYVAMAEALAARMAH